MEFMLEDEEKEDWSEAWEIMLEDEAWEKIYAKD